jgi:hypothetical protein
MAMVFLIIGTLLLPVGIIGYWAHRTFTDTDRYVETVAPLTQSPAVQQGIADAVTGSLITADGAAAQVQEWFPKELWDQFWYVSTSRPLLLLNWSNYRALLTRGAFLVGRILE